ncbi:hypothetical protein ACMG4P_03805 [Pseudovibrio denitrificans]|uniref:hypothetical protein n=1 Tax=Pseudovibrio denitrificans TaxID=258256 RepID=UPI0039BF441A
MKHKAIYHLLVATSALMALVETSVAQTIYIPEGSAHSVAVVDFKSKAIVKRYSDLEAVHGLAIAKEKQLLIAGSLSEIETGDALKERKPAGMSEEDHAAHHAPSTTQSSDQGDGSKSLLSVVQIETGDILRRIEVPGGVHHVAVTPDERFAVVTHPSGGVISVVNLSSLQLEAFIPTGNNPNYLAFGSAADTVYVSNAGNGTISEVDLDRRIVRRNLLAGTSPEHMIADPSSGILYAADTDAGRIIELNLKTGEALRMFDIGGEIHALALTPDRSKLIATVTSEDRLASLDLLSGELSSQSISPAPYHLTVVENTESAFISSRAESVVWSVDLNNMKISEEIAIEGEGHQMISLP